MDIFTCGKTSPEKILEFIREEVDLGEVKTSPVSRFAKEMPGSSHGDVSAPPWEEKASP